MEIEGAEQNEFGYHEIIFSIVMGLVAALNRDNPLVSYPNALWAFAALLAGNLACQLALRRTSRRGEVALASVALNVVLVSLVISTTGASQSSFWPMYLLPLFTGCLYLERRHVLLALAVSAAFLSFFYMEALWQRLAWEPCELLIKVGVMALAAGVTMPLARRERRQRAALTAERSKMERLASERLVPQVLHDINTPLTIIYGSVELLLKEAPQGSERRQDLQRIMTAARACARLTRMLLDASPERVA